MGGNASEELNRVMEVRTRAIENFSVDNIRSDEPYSVLEDVFVPLYFSHRYQAEAAVKLVGGLDYNYAVKGDNQFVTKPIPSDTQAKALNAVLTTIDANQIAVPKNKLSLFPPRAFGYWRGRESFSSKTGVAFDALSATSTASDFTLKLLLHPQRANRLIQQKSLDSNQLGLEDLLASLIDATFKKNHSDDYLSETQHMININALKYIMNLAANDATFFQVRAHANKAINSIVESLDNSVYGMEYKRMIQKFYEKPEDFKLKSSPKIPDGSPIGTDFCSSN